MMVDQEIIIDSNSPDGPKREAHNIATSSRSRPALSQLFRKSRNNCQRSHSVKQKNGEVVHRLVGYSRLEGVAATAALYAASRLSVNLFQLSFKLKEKFKHGSRATKHYDLPQIPCARLLTSDTLLEDPNLPM